MSEKISKNMKINNQKFSIKKIETIINYLKLIIAMLEEIKEENA